MTEPRIPRECGGVSRRALLGAAAGALAGPFPLAAQEAGGVTFRQKEDALQVEVRGHPLLEYVRRDPAIRRPYLTRLHVPGGGMVTRRHPPVEGTDAVDHATMHPGLWLAFGDLDGGDFWRNRNEVRFAGFLKEPRTTPGGGEFTARHQYRIGERLVCQEQFQLRIHARPGGNCLLDWTSEFRGETPFTFGDQEEMGLGLRVSTPLTVRAGGSMVNSDGLKNEQQVWGKAADWCDYGGTLDGAPVGVTLMPHPGNFRRCWFHARDYGVLVANPFGRQALSRGEKSAVRVAPGETLRLRFGIWLHSGPTSPADLARLYREWVVSSESGEKSSGKK